MNIIGGIIYGYVSIGVFSGLISYAEDDNLNKALSWFLFWPDGSL